MATLQLGDALHSAAWRPRRPGKLYGHGYECMINSADSNDAFGTAWKKRVVQVVLRQHHRALVAIRRKRMEKSAFVQKHTHELKDLENEETRVSRLILECLEHQVCRLPLARIYP